MSGCGRQEGKEREDDEGEGSSRRRHWRTRESVLDNDPILRETTPVIKSRPANYTHV